MGVVGGRRLSGLKNQSLHPKSDKSTTWWTQEPTTTDIVQKPLTRTDKGKDKTNVYFIDSSQLTQDDGFSEGWLQSKNSLYDMNLNAIDSCEDASTRIGC